jgi:hypothetical protein
VGEAERLELAYENTSWVTRLDGQDQAADRSAAGAVQGAPTSSSTLRSRLAENTRPSPEEIGARLSLWSSRTGWASR